MLRKNLLIILCVIAAGVFFYYVTTKTAKVTHGFASYYTFSRLMLEEKDLSKAYNTAYFNAKIKEFDITGVRDMPNNVPTSALMYAPVAVLQPAAAKIIWTVFSVILYFASLALLFKIFYIIYDSVTGLMLIAVSFLFLPVYHGMELGQAYVFMLFLFVLSLYGFKKNNALLVSLPLALMLVLKGYGVFPLLILLFHKKWKAFISVLSVSLGIVVISLPLTGAESWNTYFKEVLSKMGDNLYASYTAYQTVNGFVRHIFNFTTPFLNIAVLLFIAVILIFILLRRKSDTDRGNLILYVSFAALNVIFAPLAEDYHYALFLPLIFGLGKIIINNKNQVSLPPGHTLGASSSSKGRIMMLLFVISLCLLSVPFNYKALNDASFPLILLAYPRLYGGILLIIIAYFKRTPDLDIKTSNI